MYRRRSVVLPGLAVPKRETLTARLEQAMNQVCILKVYPGMKGDYLIALMNAGVRYFVLELYDTGTANLRESPFSLRKAFLEGQKRGVQFFCTSQQEGIVDFAGYVTSHELWREGAVPMGFLTTESAYTRLLAGLLASAGEPEEAAAEQSSGSWRKPMRTMLAQIDQHLGKQITVAGWVHRIRELGAISFVLLRDRSGQAQMVLDGKAQFSQESVVRAVGTVAANPKAPGGFEVQVRELEVIAAAEADLPLAVNQDPDKLSLDAVLDYSMI